jgi:alpha-methylacyl-CoA racemase
MEGSDVCFGPVLSLSEAYEHPHNVARGTFIEVAGQQQPGPAPRFSRTRPEVVRPAAHPGQHTDAALADWGLGADEIGRLRDAKAIA